MAVLTASGIARVAIPLITRSLVLGRTVTMVPATGFTGPNGETITVRVRKPRSARTQATAGGTITYDDQNEVAVEVTLSHLYDAYHITDEDLSLNLEDFASQISAPQAASVATGAEDALATAMNDLAVDDEFAATATAADTKATILAARETLSEADVPAGDRYLAVSPSIASRLLSLDELIRVDASGADSALRDAIIGRYLGFTVVESNGLDTDTAVAYHRSGFVWANKLPTTPRGANETATVSRDGVSIRQIFQYDPDVLADASVLSTFAGAAAVHDEASPSLGSDYPRIVKLGVSST